MQDFGEITTQIFLVEDDDGHALLIRSALRKAGFHNATRLNDGEKALEFLFGPERRIEALGSDCVILLDIRMPRVDGLEVLRRIREVRGPDSLPVIMVTTTEDPAEMARCSRTGCNGYLVKPVDARRLAAALGIFIALPLPDRAITACPQFA